MAKKKQEERLPHWDLTNVYPGLDSTEFKDAVLRFKTDLDGLDSFQVENGIGAEGKRPETAQESADIIGGYLERMNALLVLFGSLQAYVYSFVTTDSYNTDAAKTLSELEMLGVRIENQSVRFDGWLGSIVPDPEDLDRFAALNPATNGHRFYLKEVVEQSRYLMSEAEEALASELALSGGRAWGKLQGVVSSQLTVDFEVDGEVQILPITTVRNIRRSDPDPIVRERAFRAEIAAWESVREPLAGSLNGVKGHVNTLDHRRGREDALHAAIDQARIDRETLAAMMGVMEESFPMFREYFRAKARRFGRKSLPWWDIFAATGKAERRFTYEEMTSFILAQFGTFSDDLVSLSRRAFEQNWIDAEPREGKRGGGFCMEVPSVEESRILTNFDGSLEELFTIAHELGHAYHNQCQVGKTMLQRETPMTLAETASTFCETIVTDAALAMAETEDEELVILESFLISSSQIIVDIYSRFLFEKEVFERRENAELSADDFCEIMTRSQIETYGDGLDQEHLHPYMWAWKPHYYSTGLSFYNFPYAFGLLFGLGLYAEYKRRGGEFVSDYRSLLRSTGEGTAAELAARFGMDITRPEFWRNSMMIIEERVRRYLEI
jgi:pepF/M3 family oligoendopeptidase